MLHPSPLRSSGPSGPLLPCALAIAAAGCAGNVVTPIRTAEDEAAARGFRYYESSPYLLVYADGEKGLTSKVLYLPDLTRKRSILPYQLLARNTTRLTFSDGVLASAELRGDATTFPRALIEEAGAAAAGALKARRAAGEVGVPPPFLYKVVIDGEGAHLRGGPGTLGGEVKEISVLPRAGGGR